MKNNKFTVLSLILSVVLIICAVGIPFSGASAEERDPYSYLVTSKLGSEWDAWNSMNNALDGEGNKIPTEEYVNIVDDPTESGHEGVLKIGHEKYKTSISLRVTQSTAVNYSHKYEGLFYLDGVIDNDSYILIKNSDTWGNGAQNRLDIASMTPKKWVEVNTENAIASKNGVSGTAFGHISSGYVTIIFSLVLEAGNYLYIDDLEIAAGNPKTYKKNIDTENGDTVVYSNSFTVETSNISKTPVTRLDEWESWTWEESKSSFYQTVGTVEENENTSVIFYNQNYDFTGSIIQNVLGLENGSYSLSVDYRSNGYSSAVISATAYGGSKIQTAISDATDVFKTVTISDIQVTDNAMDVTIYADGKAGEILVVDNVILKKDGTEENLILNGDFESFYSSTTEPQKKGETPESWGSWLNGTGAETQFVSNEGYKSDSAMAVVYPKDSSSNFNQTVFDLTAGKTYVVSAYVKFKGSGDARLYLKNWGSSANIKFPKSDKWVKIYKEITLGQSANRISLEFYCNAKAGDWFMVDNVKVFEKQNPSVNLIQNGSFEKFAADKDTPALEVEYCGNIPNWRPWLSNSGTGKFEESVGTITEDNNTLLAFYNKDNPFIGSINQDVPELLNGNYTVSVKARTSGYKAAVISVMNYDKENTKAKIQKSIAAPSEELKEVSFTVPVTNNSLMVTVYADGLAGQYIIIDDVTVTPEGSDDQLVLNGDFESKEPKESTPPQKYADMAYNWALWANDGDVSGMFVADGGYNSVSSFAIVNSKTQSNSLTQNFSNLPDGRYVFSAFVKSSGGQIDTALVAKGFKKDNAKLQATGKITATKVWSRVLVEFDVTSGNVSLSLWNNANSGNWIMIDNAKLYRKDNPEVQLLVNGDFDDYASYAVEFKLPPRAIRVGGKPQAGAVTGQNSGSVIANNNQSSVNQIHSPYTGDNSVDKAPFIIASLLGVFSLFLIVGKKTEI